MHSLTKLRNLNSPLLITGHTGFKGSWLVMLLDQLEIPYVGVSLAPDEGSLYTKIQPLRYLVDEYFQDIRDFDAIRQIFSTVKPEVILHMAAQPLVIDSYRDPLNTFSTNVMGTANILEAARSLRSPCFIGAVTTDKVYRNLETKRRFVESDPLQGFDPYSASKAASENVISAWKSFDQSTSDLRINALRAGNVIGGGDTSPNRLIPDLVRSFQSDASPSIRNPEAVRPWQHVLDPLIGYLFALEHSIVNNSSEDFNFGPFQDGLDVRTVAELACETWGSSLKVTIANVENPVHEANYLNLDSEKANKILNWKPCWDQESAVKETILWWKSQSEGSARSACHKDIEKAILHYKLV
jgi:CDP-glucose 4,6-dehydratase